MTTLQIDSADDLAAPAASGAPIIGVVSGSDATREVVLDPTARTHGVGNNDGLQMLKLLDPPVQLRRMHVTPGYFRQTSRWSFAGCDLIWNVISDIDQNPDTLTVARKLIAPERLPVVNPPALIGRTRRDELSRLLVGLDGVDAPKVLLLKYPTLERVRRQAADSGFRFPAILRPTGSHNGEVLGIFDSPEAMAEIYGDRRNEYYLTEFVDVRRADGLYRKTRFFFVGDEVITRQHIIAEDWSVHGRSSRGVMREREDLQAESRTMLVEGFAALPAATQAAIHAIRARVGLDYCGLDCCLMEDGRIVVFECNATMGFKPVFKNAATQHNRAALPRMLAAMRKLIDAKLAGR